MHLGQFKQHTVFKGFLITLMAFVWLLTPLQSQAQSPVTVATQIVDLAKQGKISQAANILQLQTNLGSGDVQKFVQGIANSKIDVSSANSLVNSALSGININGANIGNVSNMLQGIQSGNFNTGAVTSLISQVSGGSMPAEIGNVLGNIQQLGNIANFNQAASSLSNLANINVGDASKFLKGLQGGKIDLGSATTLANSVLGKNFDIKGIKDIGSMLESLQSGGANPAAIAGLVNQIAGGKLPPEVGKALGAIKDLGALTDIKSISDVFKNPDIAKAIEKLADGLKLPADAQKALGAINDIAKLISDPKALLSDPAAAAKAIANVLKTFSPKLAAELEKLLGGDLAQALSGLLGSATGGGGGNSEYPTEPGATCGAECPSCKDCAPKINKNHQIIRAHVTSEFQQHRTWIVNNYFMENILPSMMTMATQFSANMMQQVQIIGTFFDAKHQLETQRLMQQITAKAHKDYHPSAELCTIGTNVRSLASSQRKADISHTALANRMLQRQLLTKNNIAGNGGESDRRSRINMFVEKFCNPEDGGVDSQGRTSLNLLCKGKGQNKEQINMDVDYTSAIENKLTLELDFSKDDVKKPSADEENIFALGANLFANDIPLNIIDTDMMDPNKNPTGYADWYLDLRAIAAKRSVAQNSFAAITSLKSVGDGEVAPFLKAILIESGVNPTDIEERLGEKPSYFAQMEVMTKDLYQNPTFYSNLYDKPVNVERKATALQAIELMQDRDIYKSLLRSEAVLATLVETLIRKEHARVSRDLDSVSNFGAGAGP